MNTYSKTSLVTNIPQYKLLGLPEYYYRLRSCDTNMTSNTPANQYQKLKLIQNTVRVYASLYTSNLGPLNAYVQPTNITYGVCWNQMSDRPVASVQKTVVPTGANTTLNRRHTSVTSSRPGCQSPGGIGCDIKHNSYDRYLNRLKGKGPMRRGIVPQNFGKPIPFDCAYPVYGGKTMKTNIVDAGCDCPIGLPDINNSQDIRIYSDLLWQPYPTSEYGFNVGDFVYAIENKNTFYSKALVIAINNNIYTIKFDDGTTEDKTVNELLIYYPCNCICGEEASANDA
jgi:hypothetical protein